VHAAWTSAAPYSRRKNEAMDVSACHWRISGTTNQLVMTISHESDVDNIGTGVKGDSDWSDNVRWM
jgi:hypothetical protein